MANVSFKRGLLANLPSTKTDGAIYVTTDERAMYVDYDDGTSVKRIRLGDFREYANWTALTQQVNTANVSQTALYYAAEQNILAKWNGTTWVQINGQSDITALIDHITYVLADVTGGVSANVRIYADATNFETAATPLKFVGVGAVSITRGTNQINIGSANSIDTAKVGIAALAGGAGAQISVTTDRSGTNADGTAINTLNVAGGSFNIKGGGGVQVGVDGDDITISGGAITSVSESFSNTGEHSIVIVDGAGTKTAKMTPEIEYGAGQTKSTAKFISGKASLNIYTKDEVDNKIGQELKAINAMTYRGTIGSGGQYSVNASGVVVPSSGSSTVDVHSGDVFIVSGAGATLGGNTGNIGDMFIASGTEDANGVIPSNDIIWTYVPSGDEAVRAYSFGLSTDSGLSCLILKDDVNNVRGKLIAGKTASGDTASEFDLTASGTSITIKHAAHSLTTTAETAASQTAANTLTFVAVTDVITNSSGHVTGIKTKSITVTDTHNAITAVAKTVTVTARSASVDYDKAEIGTTITSSDDPTGKTGKMAIKSESLALSASGTDLTIEMTWGSF